MTDRLHVVVAGAGIGGLAAAIGLARAGLRVTVLERAPVIDEVGAGLQLGPNATSILADFGVLDRVLKLALVPEALRIRSARSGDEIARLPLGPIADMRWGAPYIVIHRADLQRALVEACAQDTDVRIETGMPVAGFAVTEHRVEIGVKQGSEHRRFEADLLIGADGLRSIVRERIGLGMGDSLEADIAAGPGPILNHERALERLTQFLRQQPRQQIAAAASRKRHNDSHCAFGIPRRLRVGCAAQQ